jgi:DNA polymerase I-like protein with 3'-5' exonuclease and polymerase domains
MGHDDVTNYPIQGSAFHCLLWAFNETDRIMRKDKWDTRLLGQVHDSMLLDVNPEVDRPWSEKNKVDFF